MIHYEPHPVSPERKAELRAQGFKIIDARFAPKGTQKPTATNVDLSDLREQYATVIGKKPFHGWGADELIAKIAEAQNVSDD